MPIIPHDTIKAICRRYPGHVIIFRYVAGVYVVVDGQFPRTCDEAGRDAEVAAAGERGAPVLLVEPISENSTAG